MTKDHFLQEHYGIKWPLCDNVPLWPHSFIHSDEFQVLGYRSTFFEISEEEVNTTVYIDFLNTSSDLLTIFTY